MTREVFAHIRQRSPLIPESKIESHVLSEDIQAFCAGTGTDTPDILSLSRRMTAFEFNACVKNGVTDIVEIRVGLEALVLVMRNQDAAFPLTFETFYRAISGDLPVGDDYVPNASLNWHDVDPKLPNTDIHVVIPSQEASSRVYFDKRFMEGGCREIPEYKNIFSAAERVAECNDLRKDGHVIELGGAYTATTLIATLDKSPPGTIGVLSLRYALESADKVKMLSLEGVMPSRETVGNMVYPATRKLNYYVKRAHIKDYTGKGPVAGLREFITEVTRESAIGDRGYLVALGLVPSPKDAREAIRESALALTPMER